jgi:hypothetical protein
MDFSQEKILFFYIGAVTLAVGVVIWAGAKIVRRRGR